MVSEDGLTQRHAAGAGAGVGDLLSVGVHAPALTNAGVALRRLERSVLVALQDVLTDGRSGTEEGEEAGGGGSGGGSLGVSLTLTLGLLPL